jgi:hypothetical protein
MRGVKEPTNLSIVKSIMDDLRCVIPARERAHCVAAALAYALCRLKLREAIKNMYGAWKDEGRPELATFEDINCWVKEGRKGFTRIFSDGRDENIRQVYPSSVL